MRQLTYVGPATLEWREQDPPRLQGCGEALVRPLVVASCDLDATIVRGRTPFPPPFGLGHECVGEVLEVGDEVRSVAPGDRVAVAFQISCGQCAFCCKGVTTACTAVPRTSMYGVGRAGGDWGGALSDVLRVPYADNMLSPLPEGVFPGAAVSASDNVADGWRAVAAPLEARPGGPVLVLGGGGPSSVPLYAVAVARALGAERVDYYDRRQARLDLAERLGAASHLIEKWPSRLGAWPITVDSTGLADGLACALRSTEPGGVCTSTSMFFDPLTPVPMLEMYMKGVTLVTGRVDSRVALPRVLELIASGRLHPEVLTTETATWEDAADALRGWTVKLVIAREPSLLRPQESAS